MLKFRAVAPALVASAILGSGCSINLSAEHYIGKEEKTFAVTGKPELSLKTFDGSIEVTTWDKSVVGVTIERRAGSQSEAEALKVTSSQDGNRIMVEAVQPERTMQVGIHVGRSVRFVVSVPKNTDLVARTGDGSITVTGVHGRLELRSGDGSVTGTGLDGEVVADTGDGSVALEGVKGKVDVNTGDGSVRIAGTPTTLRAHTGDGSVALDLESGTTIRRTGRSPLATAVSASHFPATSTPSSTPVPATAASTPATSDFRPTATAGDGCADESAPAARR